MKNKLMLTALAAAMVAPGVASATDVTVGGIVEVYMNSNDDGTDGDQTESITGGDVRIAIKAEETKDGYTGYASYRIDSDATSGTALTSDSIAVGIKGGFGDFTMGEVTITEQGLYANDIHDFLGDEHTHLGYTKSFGNASLAVSFSPDESDDMFGLGGEFDLGVVTLGASAFQDNSEELTTRVTLTTDDVMYDGSGYLIGAKTSALPVTLEAHYFTKDWDAIANDDKIEEKVFAVRVSGAVSDWSWAVTHSDKEVDLTDTSLPAGSQVVTTDGESTTRLDLGTSLMDVVNFSIRYSSISYDTPGQADASEFRAGLTKSF